MEASILVVDDEEAICRLIRSMLAHEGYRIATATAFSTAESLLETEEFDLIFFDIMLGKNRNGLELLKRIRERSQTSQVIIMTGYPDVATASEATRLGAYDYICKPFEAKEITDIARHAIEKRLFMLERERYRSNLEAIFSSMDDALLMVDRSLALRQINRSALLCGYSEESIGEPVDKMETGCSGSCRTALRETVLTGKGQELKRIECHRESGIKRIVNVTTTPITCTDGQIEGAIAIIHDETRLHNLETSLEKRDQLHRIVGNSAIMQKLYRQIETLSDLSSTVLICGESGTGKELVASALHECGNRKNKPFVVVNCAALADSLLESELFGHVRGAFTGAVNDKQGRFQKADGGTIFLDEIGDISSAMQLRLLRVLQEHEVERVGDNRPVKVDLRVIAATNRNLKEKVRNGEFRQDLYYRLNVVQITTPPLRERLEDIPMLARHILRKLSQRFGRSFTDISSDLLSALQNHHWPGNIRELEHLLEYACIMSQTSIITSDLLPQEFQELSHKQATGNLSAETASSGTASIMNIRVALERSKGNKTEAARLLGISRRTFYRWLDLSDRQDQTVTS